MRLQDKVALLCGAGHTPAPPEATIDGQPVLGNGCAIALLFAREGAKVVVLDVDREAAERTVALLAAEGFSAGVRHTDVTDSAALKRAVDSVVDDYGRLDILQNNVGITAMGGPVEESEESWRHILETNLSGVFYACKHALPHMVRQKSGAIVNTSSIAAIRYTGYPYSSYYASKAGLNHFTESVALQYAAQGIRANVVMPGLMHTPLIYRQISGQYKDPADMVAARDRMSPTGRMGTAWDIAHATLFLASDESRYVNGVCLPVDGGLHCGH